MPGHLNATPILGLSFLRLSTGMTGLHPFCYSVSIMKRVTNSYWQILDDHLLLSPKRTADTLGHLAS